MSALTALQSIYRRYQENQKSNSWYPEFEKRYRSLLVYHGVLIQEDWAEYTYWSLQSG